MSPAQYTLLVDEKRAGRIGNVGMDLHLKGHTVHRAYPKTWICQKYHGISATLRPPCGATSLVGNDYKYLRVDCCRIGQAGTQLEGLPQADRSPVAIDENQDDRLAATKIC